MKKEAGNKKLSKQELLKVLEGVAVKHYDYRFRIGKDELVNEAYVHVSKALEVNPDLTLPQIIKVAAIQIANYRFRDRIPVSIKDSTRRDHYRKGFEVPTKAVLFENSASVDNDDRANAVRMAVEAVRARLSYVEQLVVDNLMDGGTAREVAIFLKEQGFKQPKNIAYAAVKKIKKELGLALGKNL